MSGRIDTARTVAVVVMVITSSFVGVVAFSGTTAAAEGVDSGPFTEGSGETVWVNQSVELDIDDKSQTIGEAKVILENPHKGDEIQVDDTVNGNVDVKNVASNTTDEIGDTRMVLELEGVDGNGDPDPTAVSDFEEVFQTATFTNSEADTSLEERRIRFSLGSRLPMDETGHYYGHESNDKTWTNARDSSHTYPFSGTLSRDGYLATIRSADENEWVSSVASSNDVWIGASDDSGGDQSEGEWEWEDGPEDEVRFWTEADGLVYGYENWASDEPNDDGGEDHLEVMADGKWNDAEGSTSMDYVVEYGDHAVGSDLNTVSTVQIADPDAGGASFPLEEDFNSGSTPSNWKVGGDAEWGVSHNESTSDETLRLTTDGTDEAGYALFDEGFSSDTGITAEFDYYADNETGSGDGLAFFLVNGTVTDSSNVGISSLGESGLGYTQIESGSDLDGVDTDGADTAPVISDSEEQGVPNAYMGVGFDEFGGFSNDNEGKDGGDGESPQHVAIRGEGDLGGYQSGYEYLTNADVSGFGGIDGGWRKVRVTVDPTVDSGTDLTVEMSWDDGNTWETVIEDYNYGTDPPSTLKLGFSGSTGTDTNYHAIEDLSISKPLDLQTTVISAPNNDPYHAGDTVEYTFDVTNNGPNDDGSVTLRPTVATDATGLENIEWDTDNDDSFDDDTGSETTISLDSGNTKTVQLRGTVGDDATGNIDHDITTSASSGFLDTETTNNDVAVSVDLNTAPSFASSESLANIDEDVDPASNGGEQLDSIELFGDEFSDADGDSFAGIVVTDDAADSSTEGTWQYSTDDGSTWFDVDDGSLSASNGLLLDSTTSIRFDPVENYNGNPGKLTVYAVDDSRSTIFTSGSTRQTYDTTSDGKSSVAAESSNTVGITVDPVNDPPKAVADSNVTTIDEGEGVSFDATYDWDVDGDGNDEYTNEAQPDHQYDTPGTYTVTLTADDGTATDTDTVTIEVEPDSEAEFRRTNLSVRPQTVSANDSVTVSADIENVGDASGTYGLAATVDGERETVEVGESLAPGETVRDSVNLTFNETGEFDVGIVGLRDNPRTQTVTVTEPSANLSVTDYDLNETTLTIGETLTVEATVSNTGDAAGTLDVPLVVDGETVDNETVAVEANTTETVAFEWIADEPGEVTVGVGSLDPTTVSVQEAPAPDLSVTAYDLSQTELQVNETLTVEATVTNTGDAVGTMDVPLLADNETVATETVEVESNATSTVTFELTAKEPGELTVAVGNLASTTLTVTDDEDEPTLADYADEETGEVETEGLREAIADWRGDVIDTGLLRDVIAAWRSGEVVG